MGVGHLYICEYTRAAATATPAGPVCPHSASDFGLRSHLCVHLWPYNRQLHQCNVIVISDGLLQASKHVHTVHCYTVRYYTLCAIKIHDLLT